MSEKTEAPTGKKKAEARKEGQIARSQELNAAIALLVGIWLLTGPGSRLILDLQAFIIHALTSPAPGEITYHWLLSYLMENGVPIATDLGMILGVALMTGIVVTLAQTGFLWASKRLGFHLDKLNPMKGLKRLFSKNGLFELIKSLLKLALVGWVAYNYIQPRMSELVGLAQLDFQTGVTVWVQTAVSLVWRVGGAYLLLALGDYGFQYYQINQSLKMTKEEVKEEFKSSEGDPVIKGRIRGQQRRMARMRMMAAVPKADVIITNPTHLAIAVRYDMENMSAPVVLAKGAHKVAERIVALARANNIPVVQNIPLARAIYKTVEIDQEIPPELYVAMAEVLAYVYNLRGLRPATAG